MLCPHCKTELKIADRQGIEIDYCPQCRGVWLDRGELDKILERSASVAPAPGGYQQAPGGYAQAPGGYPQVPQGRWRHDDDDDDDDRRRYGHGGYGQPGYDQRGYPRRRRESWLSDLFDFD
jgi:uncharacterized protein